MSKKRNQYTPKEKVSILRRHLVDGEAVSDLCDEYGIHPTFHIKPEDALDLWDLGEGGR